MMTLPVVFVVLAVLGQTSGLTVIRNIAKGGKVTQSSLYGPAVPERAIDGSRASNWYQGSCSTTQRDKNPWWRLDLLKTYKVNSVTITNRGDCCQKRISGAEIRIGNSLNDNGNANPRCAVISPPAHGTSKTYACNGMEGRYINIVIPGRQEHLTLCEVEVTGQPSGNTAPTDTNIAKGGKVTQSSLYGPAIPERAIDGSRASNWYQGSCSTTQRDKNPWWRLDLLKTYKVNSVTITNRGDCCQKRISGAEIRIGNSLNDNGNANPRCAVISPPAHGTSKTYACNGMEGRYINIVIPGRQEHLTLCEVEVTGQPSGNTAPTDTNIAKGGKVTQSSLYGPAIPERAIDGSRASNWYQGSCSTTQRDKNPWWRLDLLKTYKVNSVTITNRGDCCQKRISGAEIRIGNSLNDNGNANPRCAVISPPAHGTSKTYACNGMEGRYINIVIPGRQEHLTLCEVEVTGQPSGNTAPTDTNIAKGGKVTQSSLYGPAIPERAIDGSRASNWHQGSCSTTQRDKNPWWRLDLLKTYKVNSVTITNRGDCCQKRISGAEIRIGNSLNDNGNANPRCAVISPPAHGTSKTYACNGMEGRYINIVIPGRQEHLTLCEVEVTGQPSGNTAPTDTNIAKGGKVTQSSLYGPAIPERAIDGSRASNWYQGSCSTTQRDKNPWWRLDLLKTYKVNSVTITNRGDCCQKRISGAEIRIGNSLNDNGNANPRCAVISPPAHGTSKTYACNGMEGRYINIVIPGRQEHLTLCEVEVTGQPSGNTAPTDTNIAKGGKVTQSSLYGPAIPERAIDGSRASNWYQGSCSTTQRDKNPWWRLDLLKTYKVNSVTITNRGDCCQKRISGAEIRIGNSLNDNGNANPRCAVISPPAHGTSKTYACNGMEGRYINIVIPGRQEHLTLCEVEVTGQPSGNTAPTDTNIAKGGKVTQSSLYGPAIPERAIDGSRASNWHQGSCSTTQRDKNPWWRLDLLKTYKVNSVTITNRGDCCQKRISGAEIRIGNSLNDNGNANPRCAVISPPAHGTSKTYACNGMEGRYINIVIPGRQEHLTLCEVEVTGQPSGNTAPTDTNIAKGGKVTQSSLYGPAIPERAIDGSRASNWHQGSCSTTQRDKNPWWRLDLLKTYKVNSVTITNRGDCCQKRISGAEIRIGNSLNDNGNANPRCAVISPPAHGTSKTYACNGMEGRYINIVIPGRQEHLTLCEVEVTGQPSGNTAPTDTNIAKGGKVTQSSLYGPAIPERAIDGSRASNWYQGSCSTTQRDKNPWWRLDLLKTYKVNSVTITNRGDCCQKRISGAEIRIGNSLNDNGNANPRCAVISPPAHGTSKTYACNGMEGRYINIVIPGRQEHLTLCEVEVTGQPSGNTAPTDTNIAKGGKVTQSSLYGPAIPERAIDGSRASNWHQGSCSTTQRDKNPWWRLDLLKTYKVNSVTITNRGDCCQKRISGAEIRIGNSLNDNGNANPRCAVISPPAHGTSKTYACNGMEGRYINIVIPGRQEHLTLCEVEVTGQPSGNTAPTDTNIAKGGKVTQSSLYGPAIPERAIDGSRASNWHQGSCSTTQRDKNPWWRLDLLKTYKVNSVTITNRGDCCQKRISGAEIRIGNSLNDNGNANPRCAVISPPAHGNSKTYACNGMEGRYINIVIPGRQEHLTLCEVEVTGQPSGNAGGSDDSTEYVCN